MTDYFDDLETRTPAVREHEQGLKLAHIVAHAMTAPGWARHLAGVDASAVTTRAALAKLPVLRKSELAALQKAEPPFGGFNVTPPGKVKRLLMSPGPIFEPEGGNPDIWGTARALYAAGFRSGDVVLNTFAYHLTPGAFIMEAGAFAVGCSVIPAGPGNTEQQLVAVAHLKPNGYLGTPDFLKILLDAGDKAGSDVSSLKKAFVSGAALPPSLRDELARRGVPAMQCYATADVGCIAYETKAREGKICEGLTVSERIVVEIVRPGTGDPVPEGEVGEVVVTSFSPDYPMIRLATGDLSAVLPGPSPCGRTNMRIKGWMGRADQTAKVKGMFVNPNQIAEVGRRHPELARLRLVVGRSGEQDTMTLHAECASPMPGFEAKIADTLQSVTKLKGTVTLAAAGSLPNDGKVIADERPVG